MFSIAELPKQNMASSLENQQIQENTLSDSVKALNVEKDVSKNNVGVAHPIQAIQGKKDASDNLQVHLKENSNFVGKEINCTCPECQTTSTLTRQVSTSTDSGLDTKSITLAGKKGSKEPHTAQSSLDSTSSGAQRENSKLTVPQKEPSSKLEKSKSHPQLQLDGTSEGYSNGNEKLTATANCSNPIVENPTLSNDCLGQQCRDNVEGISFLPYSQNSGSLLAVSEISDQHQLPFIKRSPAWSLFDARDAFKKVPQRPHFLQVQKYAPLTREGVAIGMMVTYDNIWNDINVSSITESKESFEEKMKTLEQLEINGFDVQILKHGLTKLHQIKDVYVNYLAYRNQLKAQISLKTTSLSGMDASLQRMEKDISDLEERLEHVRREKQKTMKNKEHENAELSRLKSADDSVVQACNDAEGHFRSILAELCGGELCT